MAPPLGFRELEEQTEQGAYPWDYVPFAMFSVHTEMQRKESSEFDVILGTLARIMGA